MRITAYAFLTLASLALPAPAAAASKTMLSLYKVDFGKLPAFTAAFNTAIAPALDQLLADGVIQSYGVDNDVLHIPGQPNVTAWITAATYGDIQKAEDATWAAVYAHPSEAKVLLESSDMSAHEDLILETVSSVSGKVPAGVKPFRSVFLFKLKPGSSESEWYKLGAKYYKPLYEKLVKDGVVYSYEVLAQAMHTQDPGNTWVFVLIPDMAALDKIDAAFEAAMKSMTPAQSSIMEKSILNLSDDAAHRDHLMRAIVFKSK
ncbi:MAG TPA: hypothetical protein VGL53_27880 [Bryobacteraceae bacterium]